MYQIIKKVELHKYQPLLYKWLSFIIIDPLTSIINKVISTSAFPHIWKEALVTPLPKPGDPCNPSSYRPISSLPIISKVTEKVIARQIRAYLELNYLISCNQFGFRERHSTQSLLLQLTNKWLTTLDSIIGEKYICLTTLDIKKAFDSVDHDLLLYKMCNYFQFNASTTKLMSSYLDKRHQSVKTNGVIYTSRPIHAGVPQGSVLDPLLFIMFVNGITRSFPFYLFADDCIIEQSGYTPTQAITKTNNLLLEVANWYECNLLKLNTTKTGAMMLSNRRLITDKLPPVIIRDMAKHANSLKYLGLHLDEMLRWNEHAKRIRNKMLVVIYKFSQNITSQKMNTELHGFVNCKTVLYLVDTTTIRICRSCFI